MRVPSRLFSSLLLCLILYPGSAISEQLIFVMYHTGTDSQLDQNRVVSAPDAVQACNQYIATVNPDLPPGTYSPWGNPTSVGDTFTCRGPGGSQQRAGRVLSGEIEPCDYLSHEEGSGEECGVCNQGYIPTPGVYSPDSGSSVSTGFQCMRNREPNECKFLGKYEVETAQGAFCVDQCAGIGDGGYCIDEAEKDPDEPQCGPDHPEFKGVAGYGGEAVLICGDPQNNCPTDYTWGVVQKGNTTVESCFPNAYNPPQCSGTDVLTTNQWGEIGRASCRGSTR